MTKAIGYQQDSVFYRQHGLTNGLWHRMIPASPGRGYYLCSQRIDKSLPGPAFEAALLGKLRQEDICRVCLERDRNRPPAPPYFMPCVSKTWGPEEDEVVKRYWRKEGVDGIHRRLPHRQKAVLLRHAKALGVRK